MAVPGKEYFQAWLDRWSEPFLTDDFDSFANLCSLPITIRSHGSEWTNTTIEEIREGFLQYRDLVRSHNVTLIVRVLRDLAVLNETHVRLLYENYLMNNSTRVFSPSGAEAYLSLGGDGIWRADRVVEITFPEHVDDGLPQTRADKLHDQSLIHRLTRLREADEAHPSAGEDTND